MRHSALVGLCWVGWVFNWLLSIFTFWYWYFELNPTKIPPGGVVQNCQKLVQKSVDKLVEKICVVINWEISAKIMVENGVKWWKIRIGPCESSRPQDSKNVVFFGSWSFLMGVIAAQSQQTLKFWIRPQKNDIRDVGSAADLVKYQTFSRFFWYL